MRPSEHVSNALSCRVADSPEFQVLIAVVRAIPVEMVNALVAVQIAPKSSLHDEDVFKHIPLIDGPGVLWLIDTHISVADDHSATPPTPVVGTAAQISTCPTHRSVAGFQ
jgi:hypothetical protein